MGTPIEMPNPLPVKQKSFDLAFVQDTTPVTGGFLQTINRTSPLWVAKYTTPPLSASREQAFQAFLDLLDGATNTFMAFDPRRPLPYNYVGNPNGWLSGSGAQVNLVNTNPAASTITLSGFKPGALIASGDYICFQIGNAWYLHRFNGNWVADGSGNIAAAVVRPFPQAFVSEVTCRLTRAGCEMKILGGVTKTDQIEDIGPVYSFSAYQFIDRTTPGS